MKNISGNVRATIKASAPLLVVLVLFVLVGNFGLPRVLELRNQITAAQTLKATLTQKLNILQSFSQTPVTANVNAATTALPGSNPSAVVVSQLKNLSSCCGVSVGTFTSLPANSEDSALLITNTNFQVVGPRDGILSYLKNLQSIAPITVITDVQIGENVSLDTATVLIHSYWATYPRVIPAVTEPITDLTASEKQVLVQLASLTQPVVFQGSPSAAGVNPVPFGQ